MCVVHHFGVIGNSIGFFFGAPKVPKRFKIPVAHTNLNIACIQKIAFQTATHT